MPIELTKVLGFLTEAASDGRLVLFIGAGISKQAESKESDILPNWPELIKEITSIAVDQGTIDANDEAVIERWIGEGKYLVAAQALKERIESNLFETFMRSRFQRNIEPGRIHRSLFKLRTPLIMTTNYDLLLEEAYAQVFGREASAFTPRHSNYVLRSLKATYEQDSPVIFKLHGTILEPESIVLGERDYYRLIYRQPNYRLALRMIFMTKVVLMLGFSFSDPDIADVMAEGMSGGGDFIVLPKGKKDRLEMRRLRSTFGVEVIEYEPSDGHPELVELVEYLARFAPMKSKNRKASI